MRTSPIQLQRNGQRRVRKGSGGFQKFALLDQIRARAIIVSAADHDDPKRTWVRVQRSHGHDNERKHLTPISGTPESPAKKQIPKKMLPNSGCTHNSLATTLTKTSPHVTHKNSKLTACPTKSRPGLANDTLQWTSSMCLRKKEHRRNLPIMTSSRKYGDFLTSRVRSSRDLASSQALSRAKCCYWSSLATFSAGRAWLEAIGIPIHLLQEADSSIGKKRPQKLHRWRTLHGRGSSRVPLYQRADFACACAVDVWLERICRACRLHRDRETHKSWGKATL